jgi:hypothetical protein
MATTMITKQHDTKIVFTHTPTIDNVPILLSELVGCTVSFLLRIKDAPTGIKQPAIIQADPNVPLQAQFKYEPVATDVQTTGKYQQEWELVFPSTKTLTFPNNGYNIVKIIDDLG